MAKIDPSVVKTLRTPQERVAYLFSLVPDERKRELRAKALSDGEVVGITNIRDAMSYGDRWQAAYRIACVHYETSQQLLAEAREELERLRGLTR